jgi:hypothetical protein
MDLMVSQLYPKNKPFVQKLLASIITPALLSYRRCAFVFQVKTIGLHTPMITQSFAHGEQYRSESMSSTFEIQGVNQSMLLLLTPSFFWGHNYFTRVHGGIKIIVVFAHFFVFNFPSLEYIETCSNKNDECILLHWHIQCSYLFFEKIIAA